MGEWFDKKYGENGSERQRASISEVLQIISEQFEGQRINVSDANLDRAERRLSQDIFHFGQNGEFSPSFNLKIVSEIYFLAACGRKVSEQTMRNYENVLRKYDRKMDVEL